MRLSWSAFFFQAHFLKSANKPTVPCEKMVTGNQNQSPKPINELTMKTRALTKKLKGMPSQPRSNSNLAVLLRPAGMITLQLTCGTSDEPSRAQKELAIKQDTKRRRRQGGEGWQAAELSKPRSNEQVHKQTHTGQAPCSPSKAYIRVRKPKEPR